MIIHWFRQGIARRLWRQRPTRRRVRMEPRTEPEEVLDGAASQDRPLGCGWFDSSHDLRAGLVVREHAGDEALAQVLPAALWLESYLGRWRGAGRE